MSFACLISPVIAENSTHPFNVNDLVTLKRIESASVSPDGNRIVFPVRISNLTTNKGETNLWIMEPDGDHLHQLTFQPGDDSNPCWSHDSSSIYYISTRSGSSQVWKVSMRNEKSIQITNESLDLSNLRISPDGKKLAYTMRVFPGRTVNETRSRVHAKEMKKSSGVMYDSLPVRHWDFWYDGRRNHIFVMPLESGKPVDVMNSMNADSPSRPSGGTEEFTFTPDSSGIVFSAADNGREEAWSTNHDLFHAYTDGKGVPINLTPVNKAWDNQPVFSPDGKHLAYLAQKRPGDESDRFHIMLKEWPDGQEREILPAWDFSPSSIKWSSDGKNLYANGINQGQRSLFAIDIANETVKTLVDKGNVGFIENLKDKVLYGHATFTSPMDLYITDHTDYKTARITDINNNILTKVRMGEYEQFSFAGWNNETVYGYVIKPVDFDPSKKYPVVILIHGGPEISFYNEFQYRWNPQPYSGRGYGVIMIDFHGSLGYGQAFTDSIREDWGGKPLMDLQKGLDAALEKNPWMDESRVSAAGGSYGGFMINWIAGMWPDRFRCLVSHAGYPDKIPKYYSTDELWFPEWDFNGTPLENPEGYTKDNPIDNFNSWKTPMMVIQGGKDYRVPEASGLATFTALQRQNIPSKFLYFPDENHWVLKPLNSIQWYTSVLDWIDQWTGENQGNNP